MNSARYLCTARCRVALILATCLGMLWPVTGLAWVYPEHRDIAVLAVQHLDPEQKELLDRLWAEARAGHDKRLCAVPADAAQGKNPACIDYAAWPAIAGDHSCSARDMLNSVLNSSWVLNVAAVTAKLKDRLASAQRRDERVNALRDSDIELQRADPDYATRAGSNNVHFLLARPDVNTKAAAYGQLALAADAELNALGAYTWYHLRALAKAERMAKGDLAPEARGPAVLAALADEAFAVHFLEDTFASGHVAGTWGKTAVRKGTHDYYNERGLETTTWEGQRIVLLGDAYMRPEDAERASEMVRASLTQLLDAFAGRSGDAAALPQGEETQADAFDVCKATRFPTIALDPRSIDALRPTYLKTPVPALGAGAGELPRFRTELGPFLGISSALLFEGLDGGFGAGQTTPAGTAGLQLALRGGLGLDGVMNESGDGLVFGEIGVRLDTAAKSTECPADPCTSSGTLNTIVPSRSALTTRLRMPFWLIPFDLLFAAPVLAFTSPKTLQTMAVQAANGGLIPWQSRIATPVGSFQFVLGREVAVDFYGYTSEFDVILPTPGVGANNVTQVAMRSVKVEFPIVEYRPFRSFSLDQSAGVVIQLYGGWDKPNHATVIAPASAPLPDLRTIWLVGLRFVFDWRSYF